MIRNLIPCLGDPEIHLGLLRLRQHLAGQPSVDIDFFVPMAGVGVSVGNRRFQASFTYVFWGKEFENQQEYSKFGALTLSYFF